MDRKKFRENDRLLEANEEEEKAKSGRRQLLACFLGKILKHSSLY